MKIPRISFAGTLLFSYAVYTAFVPVSIAHSIILFSLAALFGYEKYLISSKLPSIEKLVQDLRAEIYSAMEREKEEYEDKYQEIKTEQQRVAIERANQAAEKQVKKPAIRF